MKQIKSVKALITKGIKNSQYFYIFSLWGVVFILISACQSTKINQSRTSYHNKFAILQLNEFGAEIIGAACGKNIDVAIDAAKRSAHFHLHSVIGHKKYSVRFEEVRRYEQGDQMCVEMKAISKTLQRRSKEMAAPPKN